MQNLSDEDIDKLFKQAAEQQQPQFNPEDWDDMANRLEASKRPWSNYYTWTEVGLILGVVIWLGLFNNEPTMEMATQSIPSTVQNEKAPSTGQTTDDLTNRIAQTETGGSTGVETKTASVAQSTLPKGNSIVQSKEKEKSSNHTAKEVSSLKSTAKNPSSILDQTPTKLPSSPTLNSSQTKIANHSNLNDENNTLDNRNINKNSSSNIEQSNTSKILSAESIKVIASEDQTTSPSDLNSERNNSCTSEVKEQTSLPIGQSDGVIDSVEIIIALEEATNNSKAESGKLDSSAEKKSFTRLAIKATIAPDFSSDQFKTVEKMGVNYGLVLEYFMNKNLSLSAGAIWSRKYYSAEDVDYNGYHADRAYGDCRMWDIPINANYYFTPEKRYSFFASAGFSSYLMNEENYEYEVDTPYGTRTYYSTVTKENNEWFKMLNLSVGFQKQLNDQLVIQVEPFIKVPLAGVGDGNISLASLGSFFSLRYNFLSLHK
ncbi:MAG TPA: hypothetical protein PLS08_00525 [Chryseolinea sp.]|nr:hypothetical protein [Chryseolinea sp.]